MQVKERIHDTRYHFGEYMAKNVYSFYGPIYKPSTSKHWSSLVFISGGFLIALWFMSPLNTLDYVKEFMIQHKFIKVRLESMLTNKMLYLYLCLFLLGMLCPRFRIRFPDGWLWQRVKSLICPVAKLISATKILAGFLGLSLGIVWFEFIVNRRVAFNVMFLTAAFMIGKYYILAIVDNYDHVVADVQRYLALKVIIYCLLLATTIKMFTEIFHSI